MENKKENCNIGVSRGWKITAIIFIILFLLETISVFYLLKVGTDSMNQEEQCSTNICYMLGEDVSYYFDSSTDLCYCYRNKELIHKELLT